MRDIWVISDTHINHANMLRFLDNKKQIFRPFSCVEEMNERIVAGWNSVVKDQDVVYHLGDVYLGNGKEANAILHQLKGRKRLVLGNHDNGKDQLLQKHFQKISLWRMWPEFGVLMTHIPVHPSNLRGLRNVHGHIHQNDSPGPEYFNACVEKLQYVPVNIEELRLK